MRQNVQIIKRSTQHQVTRMNGRSNVLLEDDGHWIIYIRISFSCQADVKIKVVVIKPAFAETLKCKGFLSCQFCTSLLCCVWKCGFWMTIEVISIYVTKSWISAKLSWLSSSRPLVLRPHFQLSKTFLLSLFSADRQIPAPFINESLAQVLKFMNRQLRSLACHFFHLEFHFHLKKRSTFSFIR